MDKNNNIKKLRKRIDKNTYVGKFQDFQTFGESFKQHKYQKIERKSFSEYQNFLYKRALFGLKLYSQEEIKNMHWQKRKRIQKVYRHTQNELNLWKQSKIIKFGNLIFSLFTHSSAAKELIDLYSEPDPKFICNMSFKDLNITKEDIINKLIEKRILPNNFYSINEN